MKYTIDEIIKAFVKTYQSEGPLLFYYSEDSKLMGDWTVFFRNLSQQQLPSHSDKKQPHCGHPPGEIIYDGYGMSYCRACEDESVCPWCGGNTIRWASIGSESVICSSEQCDYQKWIDLEYTVV